MTRTKLDSLLQLVKALGKVDNLMEYHTTLERVARRAKEKIHKGLGFQPERGEQRRFEDTTAIGADESAHKESQCWFKQEYMMSNPPQDPLQRDIRKWSAPSRNGQHLSAKSLHRRCKHEIQIALLRRRAAMARAVLPNPSARAELTHRWWSESEGPDMRREMSSPMRQRFTLALNCTPPGTQTRLHSSFQTLGSQPALSPTFSRLLPPLWAGANHATREPADWVRLFETRFSISVEHLRHCFPQVTGSLLSLLARVPSSGVLASFAHRLAGDCVRGRPLSLESTPSRIGSTAWFLSCLAWVSLLLSGAR